MIIDTAKLIQNIVDVLDKQYDGPELAHLYNQNFAAHGEKMEYIGDSQFEITMGHESKGDGRVGVEFTG